MNTSRSSHVRLKIVALLASMTALWGFAAYVTVQDGLNVLFVNQLDQGVGRPTESLVDALQEERRLSTLASVEGVDAVGDALAEARTSTADAYDTWQQERDRQLVQWAISGELAERIDTADAELAGLDDVRAALDDGELGRHETVERYSSMVDASLAMFDVMSNLDDEEIARQSRGVAGLNQARELLARRDAMVTGALADRLTTRDISEVTMLVGAGREQYAQAASDLSESDRERFRATVSGDAVSELRELEDRFIADAEPGQRPPFSRAQWDEAVAAATEDLRQLEFDATDSTLDSASPVATGMIVRLVLAGGLGLIAVVAAVVVSVTTARSLIRQLERLRDAARELAEDRLPRVVDRLSRGEPVDVAAEAPPLRFGNDEIGQVGQAFNGVQQTAVQAAVQQADLRRGVRDVFLSLARRTQNLVHKQIGVLDRMERREVDEEEMADLYRIDHLATRMRRNAENLIVLSGAAPGRTWRRPVPMIDVIRGAIAEVEDYQRVTLLPVQGSALEGRVVGDVVHLLAELIENAVAYSPPYAMVGVSGQRVAHGFVVEIEDRGLGMSEDDLTTANEHLSHPPDFSLADASRLGHYVVAKLAQRHGVRVHLRTSPYGGITAIVLVPQEIVSDLEDSPEQLVMSQPPGAELPGGERALQAGPASLDGASHGADMDRGAEMDGSARRAEMDGSARRADMNGMVLPADIDGMFPAVDDGETGGHDDGGAPERGGARGDADGGAGAGTTVPPPARGKAPLPRRGARGTTAGTEQAPSDGAASDNGVARDNGSVAGGRAAGGRPARDNGASPSPSGDASPSSDVGRTPGGLPFRVRQASLPEQLAEDDTSRDVSARDPEQVRQAMSAYQRGTQRGRDAASDTPQTPAQETPGDRPGGHEEG